MINITYSGLRGELASVWDQVEDNREVAKVERRGHENMVMILEEEYNSLKETLYLLSNPANAERLLQAKEELERGDSVTIDITDEIDLSQFSD